MRRLVVVLVALAAVGVPIVAQEGAQYLHNAIQDLKTLKGIQTLRRVDAPLPSPPAAERRIKSSAVPPLSLTKGELAAIYEAAVHKGDTVKLDAGDDGYIEAAVHHIDDHTDDEYHHHHHGAQDHHHDEEDANSAGYYYYYYPIKSFFDELTYRPSSSSPSAHNVKITPVHMEEKKEKKALEPLFMAISGFIGMAVMFVLSVLVFPKFGKQKTRGGATQKKNERLGDIARLALQAIEGKGCPERFACELGKTARTFNWQENRFVKLIRRVAPASFTRQMDRQMGNYSTRRMKCTAIPCKKKTIAPKRRTNAGGPQKKN